MSGSLLMNAAVVVSLTDRASRGLTSMGNRFDLIDKRAKETQERLEKLDKFTFAGITTAAAGAAGLNSIAIAGKAALDSAGSLQDVLTSFRSNAFGQAILPNAPEKAVKNVLEQAQKVAESKGIDIKFTTKNDAMSFITKQADELAQKLGADTVFGRRDALAAFDSLQKNGMAMETVLDGAGKATLYLAQISKQAPQETAEVLSKISSAYQLTGKDVENLADVMVKVDGASSATVQSMAIGAKYAAGTANNLGMAYEDLIVTLGSLNSRGIDESTAGTALNNMLLALAAPSDKAQAALSRFGLSVKSFYGSDGNLLPMESVLKKLRTVTDQLNPQRTAEFMKVLFGEEGARAATALLQDGAGSIAAIREQMDSSLNLTDRAAEANKTYTASLQRVQEAWDNVKTSMGTPLLDQAAKTIDWIAGKYSELAQTLQANPDLSKSLLVGGAAVSGAALLLGGLTAVFAMAQKIKIIWGSVFTKKPKSIEEIGRQADRTAKDFDELKHSAQQAKIAIDGAARSSTKLGPKTLRINVDQTRVDRFVRWLGTQQWHKTVYIDYQDGTGSGGGKSKKGGKKGKGAGPASPLPSVVAPAHLKTPDVPHPVSAAAPPVPQVPKPAPVTVPHTGSGNIALKGVGTLGVALTATHIVQSAMTGGLEQQIKENGAEIALSTAGAWAGGALAAALGSIVPGAGTALGAVVGASAGGWLGANLGEWIDDKQWTAQAVNWGKNLSKSMADGMKQGQPEVEQASFSIGSVIKKFLGVASPTDKGPLSTNHLWGGNLAQSFADGMAGKINLIEGAANRAAGAASMSPTLGTRSGSPANPAGPEKQNITIEFHSGAFIFQIDGNKDPEKTAQEVRLTLNQWAKTDLPRHIEQYNIRRSIISAKYIPGQV